MAQGESAHEKARQIARLVLPDATWEVFDQKGFITFTGKRAIYIIRPGCQTEIRNTATGRQMGQACLQLSIPAPSIDRMVAEYLLLKNAEDLYWNTANIFGHTTEGIREYLVAAIDFALLFHLLMALL
jgi:hypothetical protein